MNKEIFCWSCSSKRVIKKGKYISPKKSFWKQQYKCLNCGLRFNDQTKHLIDYEPMPFQYKSKPVPQQDWSAYSKAQIQEKLMLLDLVSELTDLIEIKKSKTVGRNKFDLKDIVFCLTLKAYTKLSSRCLTSDLELAKQKEFVSNVPHFTNLMNYLDDKRLTPLFFELIRLSALPLKQVEVDFVIDSSGFSTNQFGRWLDYKFNGDTRYRKWIKAHIMNGVKSNIITSVEISDGHAGDSPRFIPLVNKTKIDFSIKEVSADKAYLSKANQKAVIEARETPFISYKEGHKIKRKGMTIWNKLYWYFRNKPQEWGEHYHKRSNVETCFHMIKTKFGKELITKNETANKNELLLKIFCYNLCCLIQEYFENNIDSNFNLYKKIEVKLNAR